MQGYKYQPGDQPLSGYTIQAIAGCGGFGEVYYAVSDSGREVALKSVLGHAQIELRGISQCMNLKSPHLVSIFDVLHNNTGDPFVVMEFIEGPNLQSIMDQHPQGLGTAKAAFFLREIAKGLSYLHDCGIVHRDLKPANIFYENGYVKIGDYGLSKAMSASVNQSHTVTVGSVHYMAPEVGAGKYDRSIDIYALGCLLYEMLTGVTPYLGQSPAEILMKHLSGEPDLTGVDETFARVIKKALAKQPEDRYATVQEMVEDVFGAEHVKNSVSSFNDADLSVYASRLQNKLPVGGGSPAAGAAVGQGGSAAAAHLASAHDRSATLPQRLGNDSVPTPLRLLAGLAATILICLATTQFGGLGNEFEVFVVVFAIMTSGCLGLWLYVKNIFPKQRDDASADSERSIVRIVSDALDHESDRSKILISFGQGDEAAFTRWWTSWLAMAGGPILVTLGFTQSGMSFHLTLTCWIALGMTFFTNWSNLVRPDRDKRFKAGPIAAVTGFALGFGAFLVVPGDFPAYAHVLPAFIIVLGLAVVSQTLFPWTGSPRKNSPGKTSPAETGAGAGASPPPPASPLAQAVSENHASSTLLQRGKQADAAPQNSEHPFLQPDGRLASSCSRTIALILAVFPLTGFPLCGLHRFYAGKVGTGLLWLFTLGFLGIGQLIDSILLLAGEFRDAKGRPIRFWGAAPAAPAASSVSNAPGAPGAPGTPGAPATSAMRPERASAEAAGPPVHQAAAGFSAMATNPNTQTASVYRANGFELVSLVLTAVAAAMVMIGLIVSVGIGLHLPEALASGMLGPDIAQELHALFGYDEWGSLLIMLGKVLGLGLVIAGGLLGVWARRRLGLMHGLRGFLGGIGFVLVALLVGNLFGSSVLLNGQFELLDQAMVMVGQDVAQTSPVLGLQRLMEWVDIDLFATAITVFVGSVLIYAWPPRLVKQTRGKHVTG